MPEIKEPKFIKLRTDYAIKTIWLLGSELSQQKLRHMLEFALGYSLEGYELIGNELGKTMYESIFNRLDFLMLTNIRRVF